MESYIFMLGFFFSVSASSEFNFGFGKHQQLAVVTHIHPYTNNLETGMPASIDIKLDLTSDPNGPYNLHLIRNDEELDSKPVYVIRENSDGDAIKLVKEDVAIEQNVGLYQCDKVLGSFTVSCEGLEFGTCKPILLGTININGTEFDMKPNTDTGSMSVNNKSLYSVYQRKQPEGDGKACTAAENQEIAAISTTFQKQVTVTDFKGFAMRNGFRFAGPGSPSLNHLPMFRRPIQNSQSVITRSKYAVGLLIMVDEVVYKRFYGLSNAYTHYQKTMDAKMLIRQYYAHVVNAMDTRYQNIKHPAYDIHIVVSGYLIDDGSMIDIWNDPLEAAVEEVMMKAIKWRKLMMSRLPPHDHFMIFTGRDLYTKFSNDHTVTGFASLDSVCRQDSVSIIEDRGGFDCIITATHELGHSLGARHDGDRNICTPHDKYIMTSIGGDVTAHTRLNPFQFSECSKSYFLDRLQTLSSKGYNCLSIRKNYYNPREFAELTKVSTGQLFDANKQCQMKLGDDSYYGWGGNLGSFQDICTHMACKSNKTATSYNLYNAGRGTSCGDKKWCMNGECVYDATAPSKDETCVHGDSLRSFAAYQSCEHLVSSDPSKCIDRYYRQFCCESCKNYGVNTFSLSERVGGLQAQLMSIPVTQHIQRAIPNANRFQNGLQTFSRNQQLSHPRDSMPQGRNNYNRESQSPMNGQNEFRVFAIGNNAGPMTSSSFNVQSNDGSNHFQEHHYDPNQHVFHGVPELQTFGIQTTPDTTNNFNVLPDHQRINVVQSPSIPAGRLNLDSFRSLILRTLQLLTRTNAQGYGAHQNSQQSYDGAHNQYYNMHNEQRSLTEQPKQSTTPTPSESPVSLSLLESILANFNRLQINSAFPTKGSVQILKVGNTQSNSTATDDSTSGNALPVIDTWMK